MTKTALAVALGDENWGEDLAGGGEKKREIKLSQAKEQKVSVHIKPTEIGLNYSVWVE